MQLSASETVANPWRYAAGYTDTQTGLTKFGARYHDPSLGRFTQRDPSGKDLPYAYAGCNPTNHVDPTGLETYTPTPYGLSDATGILITCITGGLAATEAAAPALPFIALIPGVGEGAELGVFLLGCGLSVWSEQEYGVSFFEGQG
jgi:RHS repeat-associated protein